MTQGKNELSQLKNEVLNKCRIEKKHLEESASFGNGFQAHVASNDHKTE